MNKWIIKIISACCVIAAAVLWWTGASRLEAMFHRFEAAAAQRPLARAAGGVYDTTDRYLSDLQIPHPSEAVLKAFADVPADDAMIFITSSSDANSELTYRSIAYLGWPRQIGEVRCGTDGAPELLFHPRAETRVKWLMFYRVAPPVDSTQQSRVIGQHLTLTPASELKEWRSYCSR